MLHAAVTLKQVDIVLGVTSVAANYNNNIIIFVHVRVSTLATAVSRIVDTLYDQGRDIMLVAGLSLVKITVHCRVQSPCRIRATITLCASILAMCRHVPARTQGSLRVHATPHRDTCLAWDYLTRTPGRRLVHPPRSIRGRICSAATPVCNVRLLLLLARLGW